MKTYKSRVDVWLPILLCFPVVGSGFAIAVGIAKSQPSSLYIGLAALAFYALVMFGLVFPLQYAIADDGLRVRAGVMKLHVPWDRLLKVEMSSNPLSSPAL